MGNLNLKDAADLKRFLSTRSFEIPADTLKRDLKKLIRWALKRDRYELVESAAQALQATLPTSWGQSTLGMRRCAQFILYDYPGAEDAIDDFPALFDWAGAAAREATAQSMGARV